MFSTQDATISENHAEKAEMRRRDHTNFSGHVLISSNMMRWNCSKISILAVTAVLASELHFPILPNFHVDATSFHVLMHLETGNGPKWTVCNGISYRRL